MAIIVSIIASFIGPVTFYSAIQPYGAGWAEVGGVLSRPLVCGVLSVGPAWLIALKMEAMGFGPLWQLVETVIVAAVLNVLFVWLWMRPVWDDFWNRMRRLLPQRVVA